MELAVLLCELLLCFVPNGEKFNYQLICYVVSGDMKFPIVSAPIKSWAFTVFQRVKNPGRHDGNAGLVCLLWHIWRTFHHMLVY